VISSRPAVTSVPSGPSLYGVDIHLPQGQREDRGLGLVVAIGESPPKLAGPADDPIGWETVSGHRLASLAGISSDQYQRRFDRMHLFREPQETWRFKVARKEAAQLIPGLTGRCVLLLGSRLAGAFGFSSDHAIFVTRRWNSVWYCIPHPSSLNRWYQERENTEAASKLLSDLVGDARILRLRR